VAIRHWKRMRERPDAGDASAPADRDNPWDKAPADAPRLSDLGTEPAMTPEEEAEIERARAEQYQAWMDRMRQKREQTRRMAAGEADPPEATSRTYWTTDALYAESKRVEENEAAIRPNPWKTRELLAVLDLREGATLDEVGDAYRKLAKLHHPDRFVQADEATREFHADRMRRINAAYRSLRTVLSA
jgi:DnaJ-domain-containing protein 1